MQCVNHIIYSTIHEFPTHNRNERQKVIKVLHTYITLATLYPTNFNNANEQTDRLTDIIHIRCTPFNTWTSINLNEFLLCPKHTLTVNCKYIYVYICVCVYVSMFVYMTFTVFTIFFLFCFVSVAFVFVEVSLRPKQLELDWAFSCSATEQKVKRNNNNNNKKKEKKNRIMNAVARYLLLTVIATVF